MYTYSTVQCTVYSVHCGCRHISSRPASVQSVADVEGGGERLEEEEVESAREGFGWHQQVQPFGQGSWHHKSSNSNRFAATGTESPSSPTGRWHHEREASPTRPPPCLRHHHRPVDHRFGHQRQSVRSTAVAPSNRTNMKQWSRIT